MVAQQGCYHPAHRYRLCRPALGPCWDDRKCFALCWPHRGVCRCYRGGDCGQRGPALDRHPYGDEKQDGLELRILISSSLQIALFVAPVLIFLSYAFGRPMDLEFTLPEVVAVVVSVYILFQISSDGADQLDRRDPTSLALSNSRDSLFLSAGAATRRTLGFARFSLCLRRR